MAMPMITMLTSKMPSSTPTRGFVRSGLMARATPSISAKNITASMPFPFELPSTAPTISCTDSPGMMSRSVLAIDFASSAFFSALAISFE